VNLHPIHLAKRFASSLDRRPPTMSDELFASTHLSTAEHSLWTRLGNADRRHAVLVARRFADRRPDASIAEIAGALLHDIGKIDADLPVWRRVIVTLRSALGRDPGDQIARRYVDHEAIGEALLESIGSDPATIATASGRGPAGSALRHADQI
jgi:hypothetical protein